MENDNENVVNGEEPKTMTFDEMLASNKDYQREFDRRLAKSNDTFLETKKADWEKEYNEKLEQQKSEAEKLAKMNVEQQLNYKIEQLEKQLQESNSRLNASDLKETTSNILAEKNIPISYLKMFDFNNETADTINAKVELLNNIRANDIQETLSKTLRQESPRNVATKLSDENEIDPYIEGFRSEI